MAGGASSNTTAAATPATVAAAKPAKAAAAKKAERELVGVKFRHKSSVTEGIEERA